MNIKNLIPWKKENSLISRKNDGDPVLQVQNRINSMFDDFFGKSGFGLSNSLGSSFAHMPKIDVSETDREVRISAELPGMEEKDVDLTVTGNFLTIKGEKNEEKEEEKGEFWHSERSYGFFERTVELPEAVDMDKIEAKFKKGVLRITAPKKPEAVSSRKKIPLLQEE